MINSLESPFELLGDILGTEIAGYSVLQIGVAAVGVAAVIGGVRWAFGKALATSD